jgi:hypothetical protein
MDIDAMSQALMAKDQRILRLEETAENLRVDKGLLERDMDSKRRTIRALRSDQDAKVPTELDRMARQVYDFWKETCRPRSRAFGDDRYKAVVARLREKHTVEDLKLAILGAKRGAYVDAKGEKHDNLELICRSAAHVEKFQARANLAPDVGIRNLSLVPWTRVRRENRRVILKALVAAFGTGLEDDIGYRMFPCPNHPRATLTLAPEDGGSWLVRCSECGLDEIRLLPSIKPELATT